MAKMASSEGKSFNPIDSKLLGSLAGTTPAEPAQPVTPPPAVQMPQPQPSVAEEQVTPPKRPKAEADSTPRPGPARRPQPQEERLSRVVKCLFTPSEDQEHRNLLNRLREKTGITLSFSHLMRPFFALLLLSEEELTRELANAGLRRPINDKNALAAFERELAAIIHAALRRTEQEVPNEKV
jgi:hypothetical protein